MTKLVLTTNKGDTTYRLEFGLGVYVKEYFGFSFQVLINDELTRNSVINDDNVKNLLAVFDEDEELRAICREIINNRLYTLALYDVNGKTSRTHISYLFGLSPDRMMSELGLPDSTITAIQKLNRDYSAFLEHTSAIGASLDKLSEKTGVWKAELQIAFAAFLSDYKTEMNRQVEVLVPPRYKEVNKLLALMLKYRKYMAE